MNELSLNINGIWDERMSDWVTKVDTVFYFRRLDRFVQSFLQIVGFVAKETLSYFLLNY